MECNSDREPHLSGSDYPLAQAESPQLHALVMDLFRSITLVHPDQLVPGHLVPDHPVSWSQVFALHELDTEDGLSQRELAHRLCLEKSTVSRLAAELARAGLLARERDPANRRYYRLRLTDRGRELHAQVATAFNTQYDQWAARLTPEEQDALLTGLPALLRAMRA